MNATAWTRALASATAAWLALTATAATLGLSPAGWPWIQSGTAAQDEVVLQAHQRQYSLLVMTAARGSEAGLQGVRVRVLDGARTLGLERVLSGPWLLVDLPPGRYEVAARYRGQQQREAVVMDAGEHQTLVFYFEPSGSMPAD